MATLCLTSKAKPFLTINTQQDLGLYQVESICLNKLNGKFADMTLNG